jgi:predicted nuclease of predicted toxin-antitoxin system
VILPLYTDQHVSAAVVAGLRRRGINVLTAFDDGYDEQDDEQILIRAHELGRIVFTQDVDFVEITDDWLAVGRPFAGVVYAHQQRATIGQLIADLELVCRVFSPEEMHSQLLRIPL